MTRSRPMHVPDRAGMIFDLNIPVHRPKPCELDGFTYLSLSTFKSVADFLRNVGGTNQTGLKVSSLAMAHDALR